LEIIAGIDEVGRGSWAGPLVAVACVLLDDAPIVLLGDSKKIKPALRREIFLKLIPHVRFGVSWISPKRIDAEGLGAANKNAFIEALAALQPKPSRIIADYLSFDCDIPVEAFPRADEKISCVSAASIIAKVIRDEYCLHLDKVYPGYGFASNKGYGTRKHGEAILERGVLPIHRKLFLRKLLKEN